MINLNPLRSVGTQTNVGTPSVGNVSGHQSVTITASQYQALRRIIGYRFVSTKVANEYALLAKNCSPPMTENQIQAFDWQTVGQIFGEDLFSDAA